MINPKTTEWNQVERAAAIAILKKIAYCQDQGKYLPTEVFEAHVASKKNLSTELVLFNERGEIYLIRRPSKEESPSEPFPGQLHTSGVTHLKNEKTADTFARLRKQEKVDFNTPVLVAEEEVCDPPRAPYLLRIYIAKAKGEPANPSGSFYSLCAIPWEDLVASHRNVLLPAAIAAYRARGGVV